MSLPLARMGHGLRTPSRTPCWHCRHMLAVNARSGIVTCGLPRGGPTMSQSGGSKGCSSWEREPGIDDDDWDPPGAPRIGPYVSTPHHAPRARSRGVDGWWTQPRGQPRPLRQPAPEFAPIALQVRDPFGGIYVQDDD